MTDRPRPASPDAPVAERGPVVVGIGASAGGLEAFKALFAAMPSDSGLAFVLVSHLDPRRESLLTELLAHSTKMAVREVVDGEPAEPDHVYIIPPDTVMTIAGGRLRLDRGRDGRRWSTIDAFFKSLAEDRGARAIGIVLSGTGSDGAVGLRAIKEHGGMTMAQAAAAHASMPDSAIATGLVDHVVAVGEMPRHLRDYARHLDAIGDEALVEDGSELFGKILELLGTRTGHDFSSYKPSTIVRRIQRRLQVLRLAKPEDYLDRLREDGGEAKALFHDLLIGVTGFFRDPAAFEVLEREVLPRTFERPADNGDAVRAWVPGCATGEEAYSIAILMCEAMKRAKPRRRVQIFATDVNDEALELARAGAYPRAALEEVPQARIDEYFECDGDVCRVTKRVREIVIFSRHDLIQDPPFSRLDLISCRNLLIYFGRQLQQRVMPLFHFALRPGGYLFLGPAEGVSDPSDLFVPLDRKSRVFRARDTITRPPVQMPFSTRWPPPKQAAEPREGERLPGDLRRVAERVLFAEYGPPFVVVGRDGEVIHFSGKTGRYLEAPPGEPTQAIVALVCAELRPDLRTVLREARREGREAVRPGVRFRRDGEEMRVDLVARPLPEAGRDSEMTMVVFRPVPAAGPAVPPAERLEHDDGARVVEELEQELQSTRESLQSTVEELETSNEELKSSNEELLSMNEELQSSNEELQTSREELQSVNEELSTVNAELTTKVDELAHANADLKNLFESTDIATLFLDRELRVRTFTPAARGLFSLLDHDVGRPISDLASGLDYSAFTEDLRAVLRTLEPVEREVRGTDDSWHLARLLPYRTLEGDVEGVVVTFFEVTDLRRSQEEVVSLNRQLERRVAETRTRVEQQAAAARLGLFALSDADLSEVFDTAVEAVASTLGAEFAKILELDPGGETLLLRAGVGWHEGLVGEARVGVDLGSQAGYTLRSAEPVIVEDLSREERFDGPSLLTEHGVVSGISVIIQGRKGPWGVFGAHTAERRTFIRDDVRFLQVVANVVSAAIERDQIAADLARSERELALKITAERLRRAERLAAIGTLAAGIAHEINNPVNSILVTAEAARIAAAGGADPEALERALGVIEEEAERCGRIVKNVLGLARDEHAEKSVEDCNAIVQTAVAMADKYARSRGARIELELDGGPLPVEVSPGDLQQVLLNLLQNAVDVAEDGEVKVTVATRPGDGEVVLTVADDGPGMEPAVRDRIFDPFFSTRRAKGGTGLGLSLAHGIVTELGGTIGVESDPGDGARFTITLPLARGGQRAEE